MDGKTKEQARKLLAESESLLGDSEERLRVGPLSVETLALSLRLSVEAGQRMVGVQRLITGVKR